MNWVSVNSMTTNSVCEGAVPCPGAPVPCVCTRDSHVQALAMVLLHLGTLRHRGQTEHGNVGEWSGGFFLKCDIDPCQPEWQELSASEVCRTELASQRELPAQGSWDRNELNSETECTRRKQGRGGAGGAIVT